MTTRTLHKRTSGGRRPPANTNASSRKVGRPAAGGRDEGASLRKLAARVPAGATIRRQYVLCGRCPKWHGPYWYAYWFTGGKTRSAYIGSDERLARFLDARSGRADSVDYIGEPAAPRSNAGSGKGLAAARARAIGLLDDDDDDDAGDVAERRAPSGARGRRAADRKGSRGPSWHRSAGVTAVDWARARRARRS